MQDWIRRSEEGGKTAHVNLGVWYDSETGHIHLAAPGSSWFHTTVCDSPGSKRSHANLFHKLARLLEEAGLPGPKAQGRVAE